MIADYDCFLPSKYFTRLVHAKMCIILLITEFYVYKSTDISKSL